MRSAVPIYCHSLPGNASFHQASERLVANWFSLSSISASSNLVLGPGLRSGDLPATCKKSECQGIIGSTKGPQNDRKILNHKELKAT